MAMIPSAPTIARHLRPSISYVRRTDAGIESTSRGTVPGSSFASFVPLAALIGFRAEHPMPMPAAPNR